MQRIVLFGNSGAGKSTLARALASQHGLAHLDLDTLAWLPTEPPQRSPLAQAQSDIEAFMAANAAWVIEGCYADLLGIPLALATKAIWLDLPVAACQANARARPWEPHKYPDKAAQDANLPMLLDWISQYATRTDTFSRQAHSHLYHGFVGPKHRQTGNNPF